MKTTMTIFQPGNEPVRRIIDLPDEPEWKHLQKVLSPLTGDNCPEHVAVLHEGERRDMFVHESGHLIGLPRNEDATKIYRNASLRREPNRDPETLPFIVGPAILFDRQVWF